MPVHGFVRGFLAIALVACGAAPPSPRAPPAPATPREAPAPPPPPPPVPVPLRATIAMGPIEIALSRSMTAQTLHVVDELSGWESFRRGSPYAAWAKEAALDEGDRAMLARHAKLRARRGVGAIDDAFLVDESIDDAAKGAIEKRLLSRTDAEDERATLAHFATKLAPLFEAQRANVEETFARLASIAPRAAPLATQVARFVDVKELRVSVFLASDPSPARAAGVLRGGAVVLEVLARSDARLDVDETQTFFHAVFHAVLAQRRASIAMGVEKCREPVDEETMTEGLAYAIAPGLAARAIEGEGDPLATIVARDRARPLAIGFVRDERLGLALRTELASALEGGRGLHDFLPSACDAWAKVARREPARAP